jgi:type IV secretion system protein VirD4
LDDFASGASIQNFDNVLSIIRSREISASIIIQSLSQLESKYSKAESASIINNCDHILYMAGRDYETSRLVSNYLDKSVHTVLNLPRDKAVVIRSGEGGKIVDKLKAYHVEEDLAKTLEQDILRAITFGKQ